MRQHDREHGSRVNVLRLSTKADRTEDRRCVLDVRPEWMFLLILLL
jgi:hypothetical protein